MADRGVARGSHSGWSNDAGLRSPGPSLSHLSHEGEDNGSGPVSWLAGHPTPRAFHFDTQVKSSGVVRVSSPLTVAGPRRIYTGLPLVVEPSYWVAGPCRPVGAPASRTILGAGKVPVNQTAPDHLVVGLVAAGE